MGEAREHDTQLTRAPVCPWCGYLMQDAWELDLEGDGSTSTSDCGDCEREYKVTMELTVQYSTEKVEQGEVDCNG